MQKKYTKNCVIDKENDHKNMNKKELESTHKIDRLLFIKKIGSMEERETRQIRALRNSKELRAPSKSLNQKLPRHELKPLLEPLTNTQHYLQMYAPDLLELSLQQAPPLGSFLMAHDIDKGLRARMLDWMIEVTSSYKFSPKTYFASIELMDRYFKMQDQRLPITKLHIIGVVAMLMATKMDEVYPLKIKTVYEKIVHKKIEKKDIVQMQCRMAHKLGFTLNVWSFYDLALLKLHQSYTGKNEEALKQIQDICHLIAKFIAFNYELYGHYSINILADALLKTAFKVYGSQKAKLAMGDRQGFETSRDLHTCIQLILDTIKTFKNSHRNLTNIFKFAQDNTLARLQDFFKHY